MKYFLVILLLLTITPSLVFAQKAFTFTPLGSYQTQGTINVTIDGTKYRAAATVQNLPSPIPNNGLYYVLWATIQDGRADNLGTIANNQATSSTLNGIPKQFFITAEKERFPEFVQGPRITQTSEFAATELSPLPTASPTPKPVTSGSTPPIGGAGPIGQANDAPETGLGGSYVFYTIIAAMIVFGTFGALVTLKNAH